MSEIKKVLSDHGAKMAQPGSLTWMFNVPITGPNEASGKSLEDLLNILDDNDDVEDVTTNLKDDL